MFTGFVNGGTPIEEQKRGMPSSPSVVDNSKNPVIIRSIMNMRRDELAFWNGMTCFYNRWWVAETDRITLPFALFHINKYSETQNVEVSNKRILMYEPPEVKQKMENNQGIMQTITDNVVVQPREYQMEITVPFMPYGRSIKEAVKISQETLNSFINITSDTPGVEGGLSASGVQFITQQLDRVFGYANVANNAVANQESLISGNAEAVSGENRMVNKNSIDAMIESGRVIAFKNWTGMDIKYVLITNKISEKRGNEDDVWRMTLTLKELPVLSLTPVQGEVKPLKRTWVKQTTNDFGAILGLPKLGEDLVYLQEGEDKE